jgi:uncharacterized protein
MRWTPGGVSGDVEDRRGDDGGGFRGTPLGIAGTILLLVLSLTFHHDFISLFSGPSSASPPLNQPSPAVQDSAEANLVQFVSFVLDDTQKTWEQTLPEYGVQYRHAKLVLFRDQTQSSCGLAHSATGLSIVLRMKTFTSILAFMRN